MITHKHISTTFIMIFAVLVLGIWVLPSGLSGQSVMAATSRPNLTFSNPAAQSSLGAAYNGALRNLLDVNTVVYDPAVYNGTGLMTNPPGTFIRAGGGYSQPWTRDASVNSWNAASLLESSVAANTLWSVVTRQPNGALIVQQDNQWWDQVIWVTAAWNHYLVTGDQTFLNNAYQTATNTLNLQRTNRYNTSYGLFGGPSFFNDGIAGYPAPPADAGETLGGFVLSYPPTYQMMALSTNTLYYQAYRSAAQMATALGRPSTEIDPLNSMATSLATAINQRFWIPASGQYGYMIHNGDSLSGTLDTSEEGTGQSFAILFGIADATKSTSILQKAHIQPHGIVDVYPNFARYSDAQPGRHNKIVWPMIQGFWALAGAKYGDEIVFSREVANLARLANANGGSFYEIYNAQTGAVDGGWQTGFHWGSEPDQTWSATAYLRMIYSGLFGMNFTTSGIQFQPLLPSGWGDVTLSGLNYRGMTLNISLHGAGNTISNFKLDGNTTTTYSVPATLTGTHTIDITLTGSTILQAEQAVLASGASVNTNHASYIGTGFVDGYWTAGATTTFTTSAPSSGNHGLTLRYANGTGATRTLSLYVNGSKVRQISLPTQTNWDMWALATDTVTLNAGNNTIAYRYDTGDSGNVNLDALILSWGVGPTPTPTPTPTNTPTPTPTTPPPGGNLALNKPATADSSCNTNEGPAKAVNGSWTGGNSDKWCSGGAARWLRVDLGSNYSVASFTIRHAGAGGESTTYNTRAFTIQLSTDGSNWGTAVVTVTANTANVTTHNITAATARYVRLNVTAPDQSTGTVARIYELEVYGSAGPTSTPPPGGDTTDPQTGTITARGQNGTAEGMAKAFDNLTSTKWLDFSPDANRASWIQYLYPGTETHVVTRYTITSANDAPERDPYTWRLFGVNASGATILLDTRTAQIFSGRFVKNTYTITNTTAYRGYRLQIDSVLTPSTANSVQLSEIEFIGN